MPREQSSSWVNDLYHKVDTYKLVENLDSCLACGKCVGQCPVASLTPSYNPRQIIQDILTGNKERWLDSEEIWRCFWCAGCYTVCPMDIHFPLLMMQIRYRAIEEHYGLKHFLPFKKFALRAREEGLTFTPGSSRGRERIMKMRSSIGAEPWPEISEKAKNEYQALFDITGTTAWLDSFDEDQEKPVKLKYLEGRIVDE